MNRFAVVTKVALMVTLAGCGSWLSSRMNLSELKSSCAEEIKSSSMFRFKTVNVNTVEILAWYRDKDPKRPRNIDCALCWANIVTNEGPKWVVIQMARNPNQKLGRSEWHAYFVFDAKNDWLLFFDKPPKNSDIYTAFGYFDWKPKEDWSRYDSFIDTKVWARVIGEPPARAF